MLDYIKSHVPEARKAPLAGSSVYVDRGFLARDMPELDAYLHYRLVDVSSIKELVRRWYPRVYFNAPAKRGNHRALADARESIAELRYYRETVLVPQPGPDTDASRETPRATCSPRSRPDPSRSAYAGRADVTEVADAGFGPRLGPRYAPPRSRVRV